MPGLCDHCGLRPKTHITAYYDEDTGKAIDLCDECFDDIVDVLENEADDAAMKAALEED